MKLIEKFSRLHGQTEKLVKLLKGTYGNGWIILYQNHYATPLFLSSKRIEHLEKK